MSVVASFQGVLLVLTPMVTAVTTTALVAGQSDAYLIWAAFAAFLVCGMITALQAARVWRFGTGHVLLTAASVSLIVVSVPALSAGGPGLLSAVIVAGALFQFALSAWLPLLRRIITPVVTGTALMLLAATVIPIAAGRVIALPDGATQFSGPVAGLATLSVLALLGTTGCGRMAALGPPSSPSAQAVSLPFPMGCTTSDWLPKPSGWVSPEFGSRTFRYQRRRLSLPLCQ